MIVKGIGSARSSLKAREGEIRFESRKGRLTGELTNSNKQLN